jgi:glycerol-3-phosphate dehydrogenase
VTIAGGKWTTYRKMAEDTVDQAALIAGLPETECPTRKLRIHGWLKNMDPADPLCAYGSDAVFIRRIIDADPGMGEKLHDHLPIPKRRSSGRFAMKWPYSWKMCWPAEPAP